MHMHLDFFNSCEVVMISSIGLDWPFKDPGLVEICGIFEDFCVF